MWRQAAANCIVLAFLLNVGCGFQGVLPRKASARRSLAAHPSSRLCMQLEASSSSSVPDLRGKVVYQRIIHRLSPQSDVDLHDGFAVEERVRFRPSVEDEGYMEPVGRRTLILRGPPQTDQAVVGPELYRLDVHEESGEVHSGAAGNDLSIEAAICTILYFGSNPDLLVGNVMDLQCQLGLAGLLGSIAAGFTENENPAPPTPSSDEEDLLFHKPSPLPSGMESLTLVDNNQHMVNLAFANAKNSNLPPSKVDVDELDWIHARPRPQKKKYHVVLGSDVYFSYPTAKALARTVAYALEPQPWSKDGNDAAARFVLVYRENNDEMIYLKRFLSKGYLMALDVGYLKLQKLLLQPSIVSSGVKETSSEEFEAKHLPVNVQITRESTFECLTALHSPDYSGDNGDYFFPMENGAYDGGGGGSNELEREWSRRGPW